MVVMMQEDSSQPFFGGGSYGTNSPVRRYEPPQDFPISSSVPDPDYYTATSTSAQVNQPMLQPFDANPRPKNFPPCKPLVHHNINVDIIPEKRLFVRKVLVGWFFHSFCLVWNFVVILGALVLGEIGIIAFLLGLADVVLGPIISFCVYYLVYRAIRTSSAFFFVLWFSFFVGQLGAELFFAIGLDSYGAAGFVMMVSTFSDSKVILGILTALSTFMWIGVFVYNIWIFYHARLEYKSLGGTSAATKEFATRGAKAAYDNRGFVKEVIVENKDALKQVALDNKDTLINFAKEHREEIIQVAQDNKETVARVATENKDTIWENRDVVASVFEDSKQ